MELHENVSSGSQTFPRGQTGRHDGTILVNNQLGAKFFMYVYFYSLNFSGSNVPIIRRIIVSMRHLVYVTV